MCGSKQHADGSKKQNGERVPQRQRVGRRLLRDRRLPDDHASEKRAERHRRAERVVRPRRDRDGHHEHRQREQLARPQPRDPHHDPRDDFGTRTKQQRDEDREFDEGDQQRHAEAALHGIRIAATRADRWEQHEHQHRQQVFDDQPSDRDVTGGRIHNLRVGQHADQHDRARDGQREAENESCLRPHPKRHRRRHAQCCRERALRDRPRHGDILHREQILQMKVQPHAEHQQDHAHFRELRREVLIALEPRRMRPDRDPADEIADDRREPDLVRDDPADPRRRERRGDGRDQRQVVPAGPPGGEDVRKRRHMFRSSRGTRTRQPGALPFA